MGWDRWDICRVGGSQFEGVFFSYLLTCCPKFQHITFVFERIFVLFLSSELLVALP